MAKLTLNRTIGTCGGGAALRWAVGATARIYFRDLFHKGQFRTGDKRTTTFLIFRCSEASRAPEYLDSQLAM